MGNCVSVNKKKVEPKKSITLAIVGLDNAGKTTLTSVLCGDQPDPDIAPTVGFRNVKFTSASCDVTVFDVGGGKNIRPIWKNYFAEVFGIMFVIDSSLESRIIEAREVFKETLGNDKVSGKPVLILANKVDKTEHLKETEIFKGLDIDKTVNSNKCPSKLVMVSALKGVGTKMDKEISEGLTWLLNEIKKSWATLLPRVQNDMEAEKSTKDKEREERRARVKKQREDREKAEELERTALGLTKKEESDDEDFVKGNPFKALDLAQLETKEKMLKAEKRLKEEKLNQLSRTEDLRRSFGARKSLGDSNARRSLDDLDIIKSTKFSPEKVTSGPKMGLTSLDLGDSLALQYEVNDNKLSLFGRNTRPQTLPRLEPLPRDFSDKKLRKKKKRLTDYNLSTNEAEDHVGSRSADLLNYEHRLRIKESEVHELTPRLSKPKVTKTIKASKIDEEEENSNQETDSIKKFHKDDINSNHLSFRKPKLEISKFEKENHNKKGYETFPRDLDREDSVYSKTLKRISPPSLNRFDEDKEDSSERENIEEASDDDDRDDYVSFQNHRNVSKVKQFGNNKKLSSGKLRDDVDVGGYSRDNIFNDTLRFPRNSRGSDNDSLKDSDDSPRDLQKEIRNAQQLYNSGHLKGWSKIGSSEMPQRRSSELNSKGYDTGKGNNLDRPETRRKKKRNIFRSNKLAPSDDDADSSVSEAVSSPRLVKNSSQHESPVKHTNSRVTQLHKNTPQDFTTKWGLADELPSIEDDYTIRKIPNFDDSEADDIVF
ncbi:hypothetical protein Btru_061827 [Bulinus truncatus]|nr:hypothetical protein Btru_061827 [Bulinus truncatus]